VPSNPPSPEIAALLDATVDGVVMIDHRGSITAFNRAAERLFGYSSDELEGRNVSVLMTAAHRDHHDAYIERFARTREPRIIGIGREVQARRKDGSEFTVFLSVGEIPGSDPRRYVGYIHDLSARLAAEDEARSALARLNHVARLATMGEMAAGISHELNQPLAAINTYAQACARLLTRPHPDIDEVRDALGQISDQALRAGEVIRRLRSLVRNEDVRRELVAPNDIIRDINTLLTSDARMHDARLVLELADDLPQVRVDPIQIQQVILNLVHNAFEAIRDSSDATSRDVVLSTHLIDGHVEVAVCDGGPGLSEETAVRLFEPFFTTKATGTGLGLSISRSIVQAHGGKLIYDRNSPRGTCFRFSFPS